MAAVWMNSLPSDVLSNWRMAFEWYPSFETADRCVVNVQYFCANLLHTAIIMNGGFGCQTVESPCGDSTESLSVTEIVLLKISCLQVSLERRCCVDSSEFFGARVYFNLFSLINGLNLPADGAAIGYVVFARMFHAISLLMGGSFL